MQHRRYLPRNHPHVTLTILHVGNCPSQVLSCALKRFCSADFLKFRKLPQFSYDEEVAGDIQVGSSVYLFGDAACGLVWMQILRCKNGFQVAVTRDARAHRPKQ